MFLHATCVAIGDEGVLLAGPSGIGKSDLALRLIDGGAMLVADDQTILRREGESVYASAPSSIAGLLEVRQVGLVKFPYQKEVKISLYVDLASPDASLERFPEASTIILLDQTLWRLTLKPSEASAAAKIRAALRARPNAGEA